MMCCYIVRLAALAFVTLFLGACQLDKPPPDHGVPDAEPMEPRVKLSPVYFQSAELRSMSGTVTLLGIDGSAIIHAAGMIAIGPDERSLFGNWTTVPVSTVIDVDIDICARQQYEISERIVLDCGSVSAYMTGTAAAASGN